jgi:Cu-Zn family superoxide dismutase
MRRFAVAAVLTALVFPVAAEDHGVERVVASFIGLKGETVGTLELIETDKGVLVKAELRGLKPGLHGFHFHEKAVCDPATKFTSAGAHFDHSGHKHTKRGTHMHGPMAGDMPNQPVGPDGVLRVSEVNANVTLRSGHASLLDHDGAALIVHAEADDYKAHSTAAGARIACAEIKRR